MKKLLYTLVIIFSILSCEKNEEIPAITQIDYVGFESGFILGVDPTGTATETVRIATSNTSNNDRVFNLLVDTDLTTADIAAYTVPSTVTIPANNNVGHFNVEVVGENVNPVGDDILAIKITSEDESIFISEPISLNLKQVCPNPELILDITFDDWPEEIYWRIVDASDNTVFESATPAGFGAYDGLTGGVTRNLCLASGSYTFSIFDGFEDGAGPYSLIFDGEVIHSSDGSYGASESVSINIP